MTTNKKSKGCSNNSKKCCGKSKVKSNALKRVEKKLSLWQRFLAYLQSPAK